MRRNVTGALRGSAVRASLGVMIWKLLLTASVIVGAYLVYRGRVRRAHEAAGGVSRRPPFVSRGMVRVVAYLMLATMLLGSLGYVVRDRGGEHDFVRVQVINANSGAVTEYQARRGSVDGRRFVTPDGREVRLADVERLIIDEAAP